MPNGAAGCSQPTQRWLASPSVSDSTASASPATPARSGMVASFGASDLVEVVRAFSTALTAHREVINRLNVYPVPDGDTGTNMSLTLSSVLTAISEATHVDETTDVSPDFATVCGAISHGSLMGARGNSGVILSQILRGLASTFQASHEAGASIDGDVLAEAFTAASVAADGAVMRPVEGTILTVAREVGRGAREATDRSLIGVLESALSVGEVALERTPDQLPVLAEAGVVDAGGAGLLLLLHGALHVADGRDLPNPPEVSDVAGAPVDRPDSHTHGANSVADLRYEVMYFLEAPDELVPGFKEVWAGLGDSIVVVGGDGLWNCHIHTDDIGPSIEAAIDIGRPTKIRVTDLLEEVEEERWVREATGSAELSQQRELVPCAVVAISPAAGISRIFHSLGVQELVSGGQTMNPSTAEVLAAVERAPADEVVILPNNSNIIAVAQRVDEQTSKTVRVVATRSVPEGFASLLAYDPSVNAETNAEAMAELAAEVLVGEVTQAVRDTTSDVGPVTTGDWIGIDRSGIRSIAGSPAEAAIRLLDAKVADSHEILTIIEGEGAGAASTRTITEWVSAHRPGLEVELHHGGQEHYPYLFGIE
ncbi:MAG: DAK2 domain fusion protein YloV [Candidatus Poriferisodalaceae bacterium]